MIKLVSYASPEYYLRQILLNQTALMSSAVQKTASWNPGKLKKNDFKKNCPSISLNERGGGWWAWKPFIILKELDKLQDGDLLLYCDTGRVYPFKIFDRPLTPLLQWLETTGQSFLPGIEIPWSGPMSQWTKRDAFILTGCDEKKFYQAPSIQASFSLWKACPQSQDFVQQWLAWCSDRRLVSDDQNTCGHVNLPDFIEHRHDQSLLSLLCLKMGLSGLAIGSKKPSFEEKNPAFVAAYLGEQQTSSVRLQTVKLLSTTLAACEYAFRSLSTTLRGRRSLQPAWKG